jgi:hypothetical protein
MPTGPGWSCSATRTEALFDRTLPRVLLGSAADNGLPPPRQGDLTSCTCTAYSIRYPVNFSALTSNGIEGVAASGNNENQIAVDNSSGPASGDIYVATGNFAVVKIYGSDGKSLGELTAETGKPWGEPCGVAVDATGHVYVGLYGSHVNEYTPSANPVSDADYTASLTGVLGVCDVAADAEGSVYVDSWSPPNSIGPVTKYLTSQFGQAEASGTTVTAEGKGTLAVASSPGEELFVDRGNEIFQYDSTGNPLGTIGASGAGAFGESVGIAVNSENDKLYVSDRAAKDVGIWQGALLSTARTGEATNASRAGIATLNGSVNPDGTSVSTCVFQYGLSASYESSAQCAQEPPLTGNSALAVSAEVSTLLLNNVYHYRLVAANENGETLGSDRTFVILVLPTVEDQASTASAVTRTSAVLSGTIDPEQGDTSYRFEYGPTESYGYDTPTIHTGNGISGGVNVRQQLGELLPDTTYHYRLIATNLAGTTQGADRAFTTGAPTPPTVATGAASGIAQNAATIVGTVNTNGLPTTYGFEIGTTADYGPPTGLGTVGAGESESAVTLSLTGLVPGTIYHYRITATNLDGTSYGADQTLTTLTFPNTFATPPAPLPFLAVPRVAFPTESDSITPRALTNTQKLKNALKAYKKKPRTARANCERKARKKYGTKPKKKKQ